MDQQYSGLNFNVSEIEHKYGSNVHILKNPMAQSILTRLSSPETVQPTLNRHIEKLYSILLEAAVNHCFPREVVTSDTRMKEFIPEGVFTGEVVKRDQAVVSVDLARAGIYPSHLCFENLHYFVNGEVLRQDHFYMQRKVNEKNEVIGVDVAGSKIGGGVENAMVLYPDPMGATGGSLSYAIDYYKNHVEGKALKHIALHLIVTPEYIKRMKTDHPDLEIFALRLDRGLSSDEILKTIPGTNIDEERGLTDTQYIVPGAGGVGEILNNSFV